MTTTGTMTLREFLLARISEDEAVAREWPTDGKWGRYDAERMWMDVTGRPIYAPRDRVLAECEAKRRIVDAATEERVEALMEEFDPLDGEDFMNGAAAAYSAAIQLLALPYADHPDYREEWKP